MISHVVAQEPEYDDASVGPLDPVPQRTRIEQHTNASLEYDEKSHESRSDSAVTAFENHDALRDSRSIDRIETAAKDERHGSEDNTASPADAAKDKTHSVKKKLYIHHRHRKLSKQFTPGTMAKYMGFSRSPSNKLTKSHDEEAQDAIDEQEGPTPTFGQNLKIMLTTFPYWNMAFWSGWCYSIGSALFVIDGLWAWVPQQWPGTEFNGQEKYGVPLLFFFGACLYQVGGVMAYLEAINDGSFAGAAMKRLLEGHQDIEKELLDAKLHTFFGHLIPHHHHHEDEHDDQNGIEVDPDAGWKALTQSRSPEDLYTATKSKVERRTGVDEGLPKQGEVKEYIAWRWWPTWHALRTYHIFEMGYLACAIQLFGVTLYGVTSVVILPGILDSLNHWQTLAAYWIPQVVASCCFLWASIMFTVMAQDKWWKPKWGAVSWWIGIWAEAGSVGFL